MDQLPRLALRSQLRRDVSGNAYHQPDLAGQFLPGHDFVNDDDNPSDDHGHGTMVAGLIAALTDNGLDIAGAAPGCRLLPVKVIAADGCGTYADSSLGGVSCTGDGEAIIRVVLARRALDYLKEAGDPDDAARVAIDLLVEEGGGQGGLILLDWRGRIGYAHSTPLMPVAMMSPALGEPCVPF